MLQVIMKDAIFLLNFTKQTKNETIRSPGQRNASAR